MDMVTLRQEIGPTGRAVWHIEARCAKCGRPAVGRVAGKKDAEQTERVARRWFEDLRSGRHVILCGACLKDRFTRRARA